MKPLLWEILVLFIVYSEIGYSFGNTLKLHTNDSFPSYSLTEVSRIPVSSTSTPLHIPTSSDSARVLQLQIPKINLYNIRASIGIIAQGLLGLREMSNAIGTPLPMWLGTGPLVALGIGLMFFPDVRRIPLPFSYPIGPKDVDPIEFPPKPEIVLPDKIAELGSGSMDSVSSIKALTRLIMRLFQQS